MLFRSLGAHIGLHRYFTHGSFKTTPTKHKILTWLSFFSCEGTPIMWFIHHNHHHQHSDTELDISSPKYGFVNAFLWNLRSKEYWEKKQVKIFPKHLFRDRTVKFIHNNYFSLWILIGIISFIIDWRIFLFFVLFPIGHNNMAGSIFNVLLHTKLPKSYRTYNTNDLSQNNQYQAYFMLGEGLHNNHHADPRRYSHAFHKGEFDPAGWIVEKFFLEKNK